MLGPGNYLKSAQKTEVLPWGPVARLLAQELLKWGVVEIANRTVKWLFGGGKDKEYSDVVNYGDQYNIYYDESVNVTVKGEDVVIIQELPTKKHALIIPQDMESSSPAALAQHLLPVYQDLYRYSSPPNPVELIGLNRLLKTEYVENHYASLDFVLSRGLEYVKSHSTSGAIYESKLYTTRKGKLYMEYSVGTDMMAEGRINYSEAYKEKVKLDFKRSLIEE